MYLQFSTVEVDGKSITATIPSKDDTQIVHKLPSSYKEPKQDAVLMGILPGKKPYAPIQLTQEEIDNGFGFGFYAGQITEIKEKSFKLKVSFGPYVSVWFGDYKPYGIEVGSLVAVVGVLSPQTYDKRDGSKGVSNSLFLRQCSVLEVEDANEDF